MLFEEKIFVDVILPLALPRLYTFGVPEDLTQEILVGKRVIVQFGAQRFYTAIINKVHAEKPKAYEVKPIDSILDKNPIVTQKQLNFWQWMADYYLCTLGDVMQAALPSSLKLASETVIMIHPDFTGAIDDLSSEELKVIEALEVRDKLSVKDIIGIVNKKSVLTLIKNMSEKNLVTTEEEIKLRYRPKMENFIRLTEAFQDEKSIQQFFETSEKKSPKQTDVMMQFLQLSGKFTKNENEVKKSILVEKLLSASSLDTLIKKGIFEIYAKRTDRLKDNSKEINEPKSLNEIQITALKEVKENFSEEKTTLLHGVTGSGKTEVYIHLIEETLSQGKQVLYLLPEIALTTQIIARLKKHFGNKVGIYHSRFNENERAEVWERTNKIGENSFEIIIGARSSIFLPYRDLGLIIVDEEHESSYKQQDPDPRYQARDCAIVLAASFHANVLLGSATPSIETYFQATQGKYGFVKLDKRFGGIQMPEIKVVDMKEAKKSKTIRESFSETLLDAIRTALDKKEQVILFQNRRGYTPQWNCELCAWVPKCKHCDVSLTYHKFKHYLVCHYCGTNYSPPTRCDACGSTKLKMVGIGTEKIEEELGLFLPGVKVARMDLDTTRSKNAYYQLITDFEDKKIDVLVGTQMVTKGLDFDNVSLVGILHADPMLNYPDFRSFERAYQLFAQVSGRAGRKNKRGLVYIQAQNSDHWIIQKVIRNDYEGMVKQELLERKNFLYPPYVKLITITLKHKNQEKVNEAAKIMAEWLREKLNKRVLGPEKPAVGRVKDYYIKTIIVKIERGKEFNSFKQFVRETIDKFNTDTSLRSTKVDCDVDPY